MNYTTSSMTKPIEHLSTGSMTIITLGSGEQEMTFFIQTETGNTKPYEVTASI